jgi:hypothetical protein
MDDIPLLVRFPDGGMESSRMERGWNVDSQTPRDIFISAKFSEITSHYSFCSASAVLELRYSLTSWQPFHQQQHEVYLLESSGSTTTSHFFRIAAELAKL